METIKPEDLAKVTGGATPKSQEPNERDRLIALGVWRGTVKK